LESFLPSTAEHQGQVAELRHGLPERLVEQHLLGRVDQVLFAAEHVRDAHVDVVAHHAEVVDRLPSERTITQSSTSFVRKTHVAAHVVDAASSSPGGHAEADHRSFAGRDARAGLGRSEGGARAVVGLRSLRAACSSRSSSRRASEQKQANRRAPFGEEPDPATSR
jgi:hypothetical protein